MITKDEIEELINLNGVVFVNDLSDDDGRNSFIEIINKLHSIFINNQMNRITISANQLIIILFCYIGIKKAL